MEDTGNTAAPSTPQATPPNQSGGAKRARTAPGRFGAYGGRYVPETLMAALQELETAYAEARKRQGLPSPNSPPAARLCRTPHAALSRRAAHRANLAARRST